MGEYGKCGAHRSMQTSLAKRGTARDVIVAQLIPGIMDAELHT